MAEPETPRAYFERHVVSELSWRCASAGCHGVGLETYRETGPGWFKLPVDAEGRITSEEAVELAYREAKGDLVLRPAPGDSTETQRLKQRSAERRIDEHAPPVFSELVRKAIPVALGGLPHRGGDNYVTLRDPDLQHLLRWIELERAPSTPPVPPLEVLFRDSVMPVLVEKGCAVQSCHGSFVGNLYKLEPSVSGAFSDHLIHDNYKASRAFLNLNTSDPRQSRLLKKALSADLGGIAHRGSNEFFKAGEAALEEVEAWIRAEIAAAGVDATPTGVVFVRRPPSPRPFFDVGAWTPGADLMFLPWGQPASAVRNLTESHRVGPADIRTPEISPDGSTIVFAMRRSVDDCLNLYTMNLDGSGLTALTHDTGCQPASSGPTHVNAASLSPRYAPDGKIYFVSTRAKEMADKGHHPATHIWFMNPDGTDLRQLTHVPGHEVDLSLGTKSGKAILVFTALRDITTKRHGALYFVAPGWWMDYHPMFGEQSKYPIFAQSSELPDLRNVVTLQGWDGQLQAGALAIFDRNMGPDLERPEDLAQVALPGYVRATALLSEEAGAFASGPAQLWRNPIATPSGELIAARSSTLALASGTSSVTFELVQVQLRTEATSRLPRVQETRVLYSQPNTWAVEPALVVERRLPGVGTSYLRSDLSPGRGVIQFYDAFTLESLLRDNRPVARGPLLRRDIKALRAVFTEPLSPEEAARLPTEWVRNRDPASTHLSNGVHGHRWSVGPIPVEADGSVYFTLPTRKPFLLQTLNEEGMAVGMQYDRWLFLEEGEAFGNGVASHTYDTVCGGCHGAMNGEPETAFGGVDVLSSASVTLATHVDAETRRPPTDTRPLERASSFQRDLAPLLEARCATAGCHATQQPAGGLDLSLTAGGTYAGPWSNNYESLMKLGAGSGTERAGAWRREYVDERDGRAETSYLIEKLLDRELAAPRGLTRGGCQAASALSRDEKSLFILWVDTGAAFLGRDDP